MAHEAAHEVYVRLLLPKKHGYPLWVPEPDDSLPQEYKDEGVSIGDVGIVTTDGFDVLFNICKDRHHPINARPEAGAEDRPLPHGFEPLPLYERDVRRISNMFSNSPGRDLHIVSRSIRKLSLGVTAGTEESQYLPVAIGAGLQFETSTSEGAILVLPTGGSRCNLGPRDKFREYAQRNAVSWYRYARGELGRDAPPGSLYLITGCDKTDTWATASFSDAARSSSAFINFKTIGAAEGSASLNYQWEVQNGETTRMSIPNALQNQCVFLRGFKVTVREGLLGKLSWDRAKVAPIPGDPGGHGHHGSHGSPPRQRHPSNTAGSQAEMHAGPSTQQLSEQLSGFAGDSAPDYREDDAVIEMLPDDSEVYHPLTMINQYLLDTHPDIDVVVTHDDDWCALIDDDETFPLDPERTIARVEQYFFESFDGICTRFQPLDEIFESSDAAVDHQRRPYAETFTAMARATYGLHSPPPSLPPSRSPSPHPETETLNTQKNIQPFSPYDPPPAQSGDSISLPPMEHTMQAVDTIGPEPSQTYYVSYGLPTAPPSKTPSGHALPPMHRQLPTQGVDTFIPPRPGYAPYAPYGLPSAPPSQAPSNGPSLPLLAAQGFMQKIASPEPVALHSILVPSDEDSYNERLVWDMRFDSNRDCGIAGQASSKIYWNANRTAPATFPPILQMRLIVDRLPKDIVVVARNPAIGITCGEVIQQIDRVMHQIAPQDIYDELPDARNVVRGQLTKENVSASYEYNRSATWGVTSLDGSGTDMLNVDFLLQRTMFGGIVQKKEYSALFSDFESTFELRCIARTPIFDAVPDDGEGEAVDWSVRGGLSPSLRASPFDVAGQLRRRRSLP
ncbi:hypothetical protein PLICRDRAFT_38277 [Plicaturopsis crispa FD-325 SS-3]|nr:hypothetical protein PLICRDRAFT_38277 [Plicaturopsis crispa FD-325 SS-3]